MEAAPGHLEHQHARAHALSRRRGWLVLAAALAARTAAAQEPPPNYLELRAAHSENGLYRYLEYSRTLGRGLALDVVYLGNPGQNELYLGAGYQIKATPTLTVTPLVYGLLGKENRQRGIALGAFVLGTAGRWSIYSFSGYFEPLSGTVPRYLFLDSFDLGRRIGSWEVGGSIGLFYASGEWSHLAGPLLVRNDRRGAWRAYFRAGSSFEVRAARTLSF